MSGHPQFVYGIGAPKAGSTWLYQYFADHPECGMPPLKELHYFDAIYGNPKGKAFQVARLKRKLARFTDLQAKFEDNAQVHQAMVVKIDFLRQWIALLSSPNGDDRKYHELLTQWRGDAKLTGDFTPSYCTMPQSVFKRMARVEPDARFIFVVRDPVARMLSNVRHHAKIVSRRGEHSFDDLCQRKLQNVLDGNEPKLVARGNYPETLDALKETVPGDHVMTVFFEELFNGDTIRKICGFLGITYVPARFNDNPNKGTPMVFTKMQKRKMLDLLAGQYHGVEARLGRLPGEWTERMVGA